MRKFILVTIFIIVVLFCNLAEAVHWPLRISSSGKYLEDQDGTPFPIVGDAAWSAIVMLNQADLATYLNDRQSKGFTAIIMSAIEHYYCTNPPKDVYGNAPFTNGMSNWSVRNESYWSNVDYVLNQAKNKGMVVFLYPAYLGYACDGEGWCQEMLSQTDSAMTNYGQWLANRYQNQGNIVWVHGSDAACADYSVCTRVNAIANAIKSGISGSLHTAESYRYRSALDDYNQPWLNVNTTYADCSPQSYIQNDYQRTGALPFTFIEGNYENQAGVDALCLENQPLYAYLGGALLGHFYGNSPVWRFGSGWSGSSGIGSSGSTIMSNIGKLIKSRKWYSFIPDYSNVVVTSSKGSGTTYHATARVSTGETVMVWCPNTNQVTVDMTKISGTQAKAWWWNPDNNSSSLIGTYNTTGTQNFTPSSARKVLVLDDAGKNLAAPGTTVYSIDKIPPSPPTNPRIISQ
jgi:hypothetical protein